MMSHSEVTNVANDAIDQLQCARDYMAWFGSLSWAISSSLKKGHGHHAERLASVAQYLADDYHNMLDCEVKSLSDRLNALELRT